MNLCTRSCRDGLRRLWRPNLGLLVQLPISDAASHSSRSPKMRRLQSSGFLRVVSINGRRSNRPLPWHRFPGKGTLDSSRFGRRLGLRQSSNQGREGRVSQAIAAGSFAGHRPRFRAVVLPGGSTLALQNPRRYQQFLEGGSIEGGPVTHLESSHQLRMSSSQEATSEDAACATSSSTSLSRGSMGKRNVLIPEAQCRLPILTTSSCTGAACMTLVLSCDNRLAVSRAPHYFRRL